jgi:hypothetical protein
MRVRITIELGKMAISLYGLRIHIQNMHWMNILNFVCNLLNNLYIKKD